MTAALLLPHEAGGEAWDTITLGGITFTGKVEVTGDAFKKKLDKKRAPGADGARIVDKGFDLIDVDVVLTGWTEDHAQQISALVALIVARGGSLGRRRALDVAYPSLAAVGVTQVYPTSGALPVPEDGTLVWRLKLVEFREPPARNATHTPQPQPQAQDPAIDADIAAAFDRNPLPTAPSAAGAANP